MFCPVCEAEYEAGITQCPDDNTPLVEQLTPDDTGDVSEAEFVPLHRLGSPAEAEMVNDILRQNGIRSAGEVWWRRRVFAAVVGDCGRRCDFGGRT